VLWKIENRPLTLTISWLIQQLVLPYKRNVEKTEYSLPYVV